MKTITEIKNKEKKKKQRLISLNPKAIMQHENQDTRAMIGIVLILLSCATFGFALIKNFHLPTMTMISFILFVIGMLLLPQKENKEVKNNNGKRKEQEEEN